MMHRGSDSSAESSNLPATQQPIVAQAVLTPSHIRRVHEAAQQAESNVHFALPAASASDVKCYRYLHGINLGNLFVAEKWINGSRFTGAQGSSEYDMVTALISKDPNRTTLESTTATMSSYWANFVTNDDITKWKNQMKINTVRIPIGYWVVPQLDYCPTANHAQLPFWSSECKQVYANAWDHFRRLVQRLNTVDIGVLIDYHGAPGGANTSFHSGTSSGKRELFSNSLFKEIGTRQLVWIAEQCASDPELDKGVVGLEVCNEADWAAFAEGLEGWYNTVRQAISLVNTDLPLYFSDGWSFGRVLEFAARCNSLDSNRDCRNPVIVDTHKYYCHTPKDKSMTAAEIIARVSTGLNDLDEYRGRTLTSGPVGAIVGEFSNCLNSDPGATMDMIKDQAEKDRYRTDFGIKQGQEWARGCGGSMFWVAKFPWGGSWSFETQFMQKRIYTPNHLQLSPKSVKQNLIKADENESHFQVEAGSKAGSFASCISEDLFAQGHRQGWHDARAFFEHNLKIDSKASWGADLIGQVDLWVAHREQQFMAARRTQEPSVDWANGLGAGIKSFERAVQIQRGP